METVKKHKGLGLLEICLGLLFAMPLLPSNGKAIAIGLFGLSILFYCLERRQFVFDARFFVTNAAVFIVISLTFFLSENTAYALRKLSSMGSLLAFPLLFAMISKEDVAHIFKNLKKYLFIYVLAVFALNVIPFLWFYGTHYSFEGMMTHFATVMRVDAGKWNIHPIYLSMHCSIALLFSFYILKELESRWKIVSIVVLDIVLILFLMLYAKKGPLISIVVVFTLFTLFQGKKKLVKPYLFAILGLVILTIAIPRTRNKFVELQKIEVLDKGGVTSTNIRYTVYGIAKEIIMESPIVGYGIGDYNDALMNSYVQMNNEVLIEGKYNAHNQYFSFLLIGGVLLLIVFLAMMAINMIYAIRFNNQLLILLLLFYGLVMFTENILERESGLLYFAFFLNFFSLKSLYAKGE